MNEDVCMTYKPTSTSSATTERRREIETDNGNTRAAVQDLKHGGAGIWVKINGSDRIATNKERSKKRKNYG